MGSVGVDVGMQMNRLCFFVVGLCSFTTRLPAEGVTLRHLREVHALKADPLV
jgi:hypothetical protein